MPNQLDELCPVPPGLTAADEVHDRSYAVRVFRKDDHTLVVRGAVRDRKPPGLYIEGDPRPLTVHEMVVDLEVVLPAMVITSANVVMESFPYPPCPGIAGTYQQLVGVSIARGYTHKVRDLFGGPNGCSHVTALLQAMGPAVFQATWSMFHITEAAAGPKPPASAEDKTRLAQANVGSCHLWHPEGDFLRNIVEGGPDPIPLWIQRRKGELGLDPTEWLGNF